MDERKGLTVQKKFAWRTLFQTFFFSTLLFAVAAYFYWYAWDMGTALDPWLYVWLYLFLMLYGLLQWMFVKNTFFKLTSGQMAAPRRQTIPAQPTPPGEAERLKRKNREQRLFVHLVSAFQRQGRLIDFLEEDLNPYADAQIGAAVRTIHENCRKTLQRYLSPEPILRQSEGENVQIAPDVDRHAVKLVGNVVGQPPFQGIVRHRGWQLRSFAMPDLSESANPNVIAPAEVEIL